MSLLTARASLTTLALAVAVLLAACSTIAAMSGTAGAAAPSATQSTPNQHTTVRVFDRCSGEFANFDVTFHSLVHESTDAAGGTHRVLMIQGQRVTGVSDSGVVYSAGKSFGPIVEHQLHGGTEVFTDVFIFHLITKGSRDNRVGEFTFHTTVTPDGQTTSYVDKSTIDCRG